MTQVGDAAAESLLARAIDSLREEIVRIVGPRQAESVVVVAVTKTVDPAAVRRAHALGLFDFGENRAQALIDKTATLADLDLRWHFIGHLQTNKVGPVVKRAAMVHSVDSLRLARQVDLECRRQGRRMPVLLQVNVSGEATKGGLGPDEVAPALEEMGRWEGRLLAIEGLMTMAPLTDAHGVARGTFRALRDLRDELVRQGRLDPARAHLSMGMSSDYRIALEEGATMIRIGTRIFGP